VFLEDVFVPDADVLGGVNEGWSVAMATTGSERGLTLRSPGRFMATADKLNELYNERPDPRLRDDVVQGWMAAQAYRWQTFWTVTRLMEGKKTGPESSLTKLFWSELDVRLHQTALALLGPDGERDGAWMKGYQFALAGPIYAGTNEIQRNVVGERVLGLPRK
jgi:alkylation response protein AidB-like acyl-CoA dehydrogenase